MRYFVDSLPSKSNPTVRNVVDRDYGSVLASFPPDDRAGAFALRNALNAAPQFSPDADAGDAGEGQPRFYVYSHGPKGARTCYDVCDRETGTIILSYGGDDRAAAFSLRNALRAAEQEALDD